MGQTKRKRRKREIRFISSLQKRVDKHKTKYVNPKLKWARNISWRLIYNICGKFLKVITQLSIFIIIIVLLMFMYDNYMMLDDIQNRVIHNNTINNYNIVNRNIQPSHLDVLYRHSTDNSQLTIYDIDQVAKPYGASMELSVFDGNTLLIKDLNQCEFDGIDRVIHCKDYNNMYYDLHVGNEIIYIDDDGDKVGHRLVSMYPDYVYIEGDLWRNGDTIKYNQIVGVVKGVLYT